MIHPIIIPFTYMRITPVIRKPTISFSYFKTKPSVDSREPQNPAEAWGLTNVTPTSAGLL